MVAWRRGWVTVDVDLRRQMPPTDVEPADLGWHVISGEHLLEVMRRSRDENPDLVFAELWANAEREQP